MRANALDANLPFKRVYVPTHAVLIFELSILKRNKVFHGRYASAAYWQGSWKGQGKMSQCWTESRFKEVIQVLAVNQAGTSRLLDMVKAIANSDVCIEENE